MSHQPFEKWILTDVPLDDTQQQALDAHLAECTSCHQLTHALTQINGLFANSAQPTISPGFTQRWHHRLSIDRQFRQQRNLWLFTLGLFVAAGLITLVLTFGNFYAFNWSYELSQFIASSSLLAARIAKFWNITNSFVRTLPFIIPVIFITGLALISTASGLVIAWFSSMIKLFQPTHKGVSVK